MWLTRLWYQFIAVACGLGAVGFAIAAGALLFWQSSTWLKFALWPVHTIRDVLHDVDVTPPPTAMLGVQKIIDYFLSLPAVLGYLVVAGILGGISIWANIRLESNDWKVNEPKRQRLTAEEEKKVSKDEALDQLEQLIRKKH